MNKKTITAFLCGAAVSVAAFTAGPMIKETLAPQVDAVGTCPITLQPIQSTGNLVFSPFQFHSSDLVNLRSEINDLGAWADGEISALNTEVSNGKVSLRTKMNSKGASLSTTTIPTFAQLVAAVDDIYNEAYDDGIAYQKEQNHIEILTLPVRDYTNISGNAGESSKTWSFSMPHDGKVYVEWHLATGQGGVAPSATWGGGKSGSVASGNSYTVSAGNTITFVQHNQHATTPDEDGYIMIAYVY